MGALLALASAACYGLSDFAGGLLSRHTHATHVALAGQAGGLVLALAATPLATAAAVSPADVGWGLLSGVGTGVGMLLLFRGLSRAAMSVVVPVSAVGGVALPVLAGVVLLGERPSLAAWAGIGVAVPALWLVSRPRDGGSGPVAAAGDGLLAGAGIALQYLALAQAGPASGLWPVVAGRVAAIGTLLVPALAAARRPRPPARVTLGAAATGAAAALALVCYLLATRQQLVVIAVVLSSLYPAIPVLLGITLLRERLSWTQTAGLGAAGAAVALLTAG
ncbi:EamA family transporter [Prauserella muralis]|uniref:Multidrug DMT transporter permease n=1 Tax=Prauserella muralis TaxID=588067 RepID=A0A2V4ANR6_9PSEU|nr:EamA family transporter [Prauserella muralis]PXY22217.1 multidrug DMT transporter permease [Prauserella muralis]TWE27848.1 putative membrane protein [Prauserella muralis]